MSSYAKIPTRSLGKNGPQVPRMGLGMVGLGGIYGPKTDEERLALLDDAYRKGETFWDTADEYNDCEDVLGKWFAANPAKRCDIFLGTKFGIRGLMPNPNGGFPTVNVDSSPEYCRHAFEKSLRRLGIPYIDIYYIHRLDRKTPIEKTMEVLAEFKNAGKIKHIGLSECSADSLRRAHKIHPISAVQVEYSPFCTVIEDEAIGVLQTARELGIAVIAYSPLGNGVITGSIKSKDDVKGMRKMLPKLNEENLPKNLAVLEKLAGIAAKKGCTMAQLALAWLLKQGDDVFPIPGTTRVDRLEENIGSLLVVLTDDEEKAVREAVNEVSGGRVQDQLGYTFADTPALES